MTRLFLKKCVFSITFAIVIVACIIIAANIKNNLKNQNNKENYKNSSIEIVEKNKIGEKNIIFLGKEYKCEYKYTRYSTLNKKKCKYNYLDIYIDKNNKCEFSLYGDTDMIRKFQDNSEDETNTEKYENTITARQIKNIADKIIFLQKKTSVNYQMERCTKSTNASYAYEAIYNYIIDGYKTRNSITIQLFASGEIYSYSEIDCDRYINVTISKDDYDNCEKLLENKIKSTLKESKELSNFCSYEVYNSYLMYEEDGLILCKEINYIENDGITQAYYYEPYKQKIKSKMKEEKDIDIVYIDELLEKKENENILSKEEIQICAKEYLMKIKKNYEKYGMMEIQYAGVNDDVACMVKYSYKIDEFFTENIITMIIASDGRIIYCKEENCDKFKDVVISENIKGKNDEYLKEKYEILYASGVPLRNIKYTMVTMNLEYFIFYVYVDISLSYVPYVITNIIEK